MKSYTVQRGRSVRAYLEPALRRALRRGRLSGLESVQVDDAWVRLCGLRSSHRRLSSPVGSRWRRLAREMVALVVRAVVVLIGLLMLPLKLKRCCPWQRGGACSRCASSSTAAATSAAAPSQPQRAAGCASAAPLWEPLGTWTVWMRTAFESGG